MRAKSSGRALESESRQILEAAADPGEVRSAADRIRERLGGRVHADSGGLQSEDRNR